MEGNPQGSTQVGIVVDCGWRKANNWQVAFERCALRTLHINTHHTATIMVMDKMIWASEATKKHTVSQQPAGRKNGMWQERWWLEFLAADIPNPA